MSGAAPTARPALGGALALAACAGLATGLLEVGLRAGPQLGLGASDLWTWFAVSGALYAGFAAGVALVGWAVGRLAYGGPALALLWVEAALWWRFDVVVNAFAREPRVWGPLLGLSAACLALAWVLDRALSRRWRWASGLGLAVGAAGLLLGLARSPAPAPATSEGARPNVILVTLDTARADRLSAYGGSNPTPTLDRLAREGAIFTSAIATAPLTQPSHLAVLTGNPPYVTGVVSNGTELGPQPAMLPHTLRAQGYTTAAFVAGFPLHGRFGWSAAFDVYDDDFGALPGLHRLNLVKAWDQVVEPSHALRERRGDLVLNRALPWLDANAGRPFFLWVHLFDAHGPYEAPDHPYDPPTDGPKLDLPFYWPARDRAITSTDWLIGAYDAELRYVDAQLGRLIDRLDRLGLTERTLVVVTADHGESLTEHGYLFDHGDDLFDPSLRVPLSVRFPGRVAPGTRLDCQVSNEDVTPTVLGLLALSDGQARVGLDRSGALAGGPCVDEPVLSTTVGARFTDAPPVDHSLRDQSYKLISQAARPGQTAGVEALYDLRADPGELSPLAPGEGPRDLLQSSMASMLQGGGPVRGAQMDDETQDALRALGYVQ